MAPRPEFDSEGLQASLAAIFDQAQTSLANHRKNCVALHKIHVRTSKKDKSDQAAFIAAFLDMVSRVVAVKKGPATVDRVIKFVAQYVRFVNEKALEDKAKRQPDVTTNSISSGSTDGDEETLASVFISSILEWVIQGFVAKNKIVRYQTVHLVAEMIAFLGEIDEDSYLALRENLIERSTCDKEPTIRAQAVSALARLIGSEDPSELQDGEKSILDVLLDVLTLDPAPDVRRAALIHIPLTAATLPSLLPRARDVDPLARKLLYTAVLIPRLAHPRHLSVAQRETLVQTGLGDREPAVRLAAGKMVAAWFAVVQGEVGETEADLGWTGDDGGVMRALVAFLTLFDVVGPGEAVAVDALLALLTTHADLFDGFVFEDTYWRSLTPESAVLARAFLEHCLGRVDPGEERLEAAALPVVTAFAFHVQEAYNALLVALEDAEVVRTLTLSAGPRGLDDTNEDEDEEAEEELAKREVVLGELLRMAVKLDYGDEIGRRKVYTVTRDMLAHPQLPASLIERCLDVLKEIMPSERELIRVVVEVVMDLREPAGEDEELEHDTTIHSDMTQTMPKERSLRRAKAREEMTAEEAARADLTDLRCLALCIGMLERVHGNFEDNSTLEGILADLIIPAVRRKELGIREKGLVGLGLCCLIAKSIAVKSLQLFLSQIQNAPEQLKFKLLQIVFDLMVMYDQQLWGRAEDGQAILTFLADTLEAEESPMVQAVLCVGLAKLLLSGLADDPKILKTLLLAYVSPHTAGNAELRQCLSYFFSVYCYSSAQNQSRVQSIFMPAFDEVARMHDEEAVEGQTMVKPQQLGLLVIDWTDARKAAESTAPGPSRHVHADLAVDILLALYDPDRRSSDQEVLCTLLSHLHIEGTLTAPVLVKLSVLLQHIQTQCPFDDPTLDKAVSRFKNRFTAEFEAELAEVDWAEWGTPEMGEVYDFIGIDVPHTDDREAAGSPRPESPVHGKTRKEKPKPSTKGSRSKSARAGSDGSGSDEDNSEEHDAPPDSPVVPKAATPEADADESEHHSAEDDVPMAPPSPPPKSRAKAKAPARKSRSKPEATEMQPEEEEAPEDAETVPSPPPKSKGKAKAPARRSRSKVAPEPQEIEEDGTADEQRPPSPSPKPKAKAPARRSRSSKVAAEENEEDDEAPSSVPVPKASKVKAPARRSRSKATAEEKEVPDEDEAPSSVPIPRASKGKAPARRSRSKAAAEEKEVPDEDEAPSSVPVPKAGKGKAPARRSRSKAAPEENEAPDEDAPSSAPAPRASKVKAPARRSRSKAAARDTQVPDEDEASTSVPVSKASKAKAPARRSRSKAAPARRESDPGSDEEGNVAGPSTAPPPRASRQTRAAPAAPSEDVDPDSDAENAPSPARPTTPTKAQTGRKRVRTPSAKVALPSPADRKRRKPALPPVAAAPPVPMRGTRSSSRRNPPPVVEKAVGGSDDDFGGYSES